MDDDLRVVFQREKPDALINIHVKCKETQSVRREERTAENIQRPAMGFSIAGCRLIDPQPSSNQ
jgi:hypothetical protein